MAGWLALLLLSLLGLAARADIVASFDNIGPVDSETFATAADTAGNDTITLAYTIDADGAVSMDASTTNTNATFVNLVNQFDRPRGMAGSTANRGFFNSSFEIKVIPVRQGSDAARLSISTLNGGGLGVEGQDSNRVDGRSQGGMERLVFEVTAPRGMVLLLKNWSWVDGAGADLRFSDGTKHQNFANLEAAGTADFHHDSKALTLVNGGKLTCSETSDSSNGAGLGGFNFDILGTPDGSTNSGEMAVRFATDGEGFGPDAPFVSAGSPAAAITLAFSISQDGLVSLDASTTGKNKKFANMVGEWGQAVAGSVANPAYFGKSFTLTGSQTGGASMVLTKLGGGGLGIQGENTNRVDGLNYGTGKTLSTPESLTWTLKAPPGLELVFKNWSYVDGAAGDMRVSNGATNKDFPNMKGADGTLALGDVSLINGQSLTFQEIPGIGPTTGAGIGGFTFAVGFPAAPSENRSIDNEAKSHL